MCARSEGIENGSSSSSNIIVRVTGDILPHEELKHRLRHKLSLGHHHTRGYLKARKVPSKRQRHPREQQHGTPEPDGRASEQAQKQEDRTTTQADHATKEHVSLTAFFARFLGRRPLTRWTCTIGARRSLAHRARTLATSPEYHWALLAAASVIPTGTCDQYLQEWWCVWTTGKVSLTSNMWCVWTRGHCLDPRHKNPAFFTSLKIIKLQIKQPHPSQIVVIVQLGQRRDMPSS